MLEQLLDNAERRAGVQLSAWFLSRVEWVQITKREFVIVSLDHGAQYSLSCGARRSENFNDTVFHVGYYRESFRVYDLLVIEDQEARRILFKQLLVESEDLRLEPSA